MLTKALQEAITKIETLEAKVAALESCIMASQIKVNEIIKQSGSSITIGESGDTINLGAALPVGSGGTGATTLSAAGLASSPMFRAYNTGGFTANADTMTNFADTEVFDIGSCYRH